MDPSPHGYKLMFLHSQISQTLSWEMQNHALKGTSLLLKDGFSQNWQIRGRELNFLGSWKARQILEGKIYPRRQDVLEGKA